MEFVFSFWYIIMAILVVGIAAAMYIFFRMDKKDRVLIDEFIKNSSVQAEESKETTSEGKVSEEAKKSE